MNPFKDLNLPDEVIDSYQALIFDVDGTILDTMSAHARALVATGEHFGYKFSTEVMMAMAGSQPKDIIKAVMEDAGMPLEHFDEVLQYKLDASARAVAQAEELPAFSLIRKYHGKKLLALGTGANKRFMQIYEDRFQLSKFCSSIVTAEDVQRHKPDPETFFKCAQELGVDPSQCLVFEDGKFGLQAADTLGMGSYDVVNHVYSPAKKK